MAHFPFGPELSLIDGDRIDPTSQPAQVPVTAQIYLQPLALQRIPPHLVLDWYNALLLEEEAIREIELPVHQPTPVNPTKRVCKATITSSGYVVYECPWCTRKIKNRKDFIRHVDETCNRIRDWHCPDCSKQFTRKSRFQRHHKDAHPATCIMQSCEHAPSAAHTSQKRVAFGCGFCPKGYRDVRAYSNHLVEHYRKGSSLSDWNVDIQLHTLLHLDTKNLVRSIVCQEIFQLSTRPELKSFSLEAKEELACFLEYELSDFELREKLQEYLLADTVCNCDTNDDNAPAEPGPSSMYTTMDKAPRCGSALSISQSNCPDLDITASPIEPTKTGVAPAEPSHSQQNNTRSDVDPFIDEYMTVFFADASSNTGDLAALESMGAFPGQYTDESGLLSLDDNCQFISPTEILQHDPTANNSCASAESFSFGALPSMEAGPPLTFEAVTSQPRGHKRTSSGKYVLAL